MEIAKRVVSIGAHSLDAELLGGPLVIKYAKQGSRCTLIHVTQGRLEDPNAAEEEKQAYLKSLLDQNQRAAKALGGVCVQQHALPGRHCRTLGGIF